MCEGAGADSPTAAPKARPARPNTLYFLKKSIKKHQKNQEKMIAVITYIELRTAFKFFTLANHARKILRQLGDTPCVGYKAKGIWRKHFTMTLWKNREDMADFARSGAHLESMKVSAAISLEIRTLVIETDELPDWTTAKARVLGEGRALRF
jgi:hypothetical protein